MVKWLLLALGAFAGLIAAASAAVPWLVDTRAVHGHVAHAVSSALGRPVTFGSLSVGVLPLPSLTLRELTVAEDPAFGPGPFMTAREGRIRLRLWPLLSGRLMPLCPFARSVFDKTPEYRDVLA